MHWPQWTWAVIALLGLVVELERNGKPKEGKHSAGAYIVSVGITVFLLYKGGFFTGGN